MYDMDNPLLYDTVNYLYNSAAQHFPQSIQDHPNMLAFALGSAGIFGVINGLQYISKRHIDKIIPSDKIPMLSKIIPFDEKVLPELERICVGGMVAFGLYNTFCSDVVDHQVYQCGMYGVIAGSLLGAGIDLIKRDKEKRAKKQQNITLEEKVS